MFEIEPFRLDPIDRFKVWHDQAVDAGEVDPAMALIILTSGDGAPVLRAVRLAQIDHGFAFFTDQIGEFAVVAGAEPRACLGFLWTTALTQINVQGALAQTTDIDADSIFSEQGRLEQEAAWATDARWMTGDLTFQAAAAERIGDYFADQEVPRPPRWRGFRLDPTSIELWRWREGLPLCCVCYDRSPQGVWRVTGKEPSGSQKAQ